MLAMPFGIYYLWLPDLIHWYGDRTRQAELLKALQPAIGALRFGLSISSSPGGASENLLRPYVFVYLGGVNRLGPFGRRGSDFSDPGGSWWHDVMENDGSDLRFADVRTLILLKLDFAQE
jgi:hypothetical protein